MNDKITDQFILSKNIPDYLDKLSYCYFVLKKLVYLAIDEKLDWNYYTEDFAQYRIFNFTYDNKLQQTLCHGYINANIPELVPKTIYNT